MFAIKIKNQNFYFSGFRSTSERPSWTKVSEQVHTFSDKESAEKTMESFSQTCKLVWNVEVVCVDL